MLLVSNIGHEAHLGGALVGLIAPLIFAPDLIFNQVNLLGFPMPLFALLIVPIIGIVVFLILPDLIYAYFIYDIYLSVIKHAQIDFIDLFYYSVNIHFNTPMPGINQEYIEQLFSTNIGKVIKICHLVLIKLIDVIIIGTLAGLFIEYIRSFKK